MWEVDLKKRDGMDKFGFAHNNGKAEFARDRFVKLGKDRPITTPRSENNNETQDSAAEAYMLTDQLIGGDQRGPEVLRIKKINENQLLEEWCLYNSSAEVRA